MRGPGGGVVDVARLSGALSSQTAPGYNRKGYCPDRTRMSEIKFACPHCSQHIVCDDLYCSEQTDCPGCQRTLFIPPLAAFIPLQAGNVALQVPVAAKDKIYPQPVQTGPLTQRQWEGISSQAQPHSRGWLLPFWGLLLLPFMAALVLITHHASFTWVPICFGLCALLAGFYVALARGKGSSFETVLRGILYSVGVVFVYLVLSFGVLFIGCIALLGS